jgi:hypothetical protein
VQLDLGAQHKHGQALKGCGQQVAAANKQQLLGLAAQADKAGLPRGSLGNWSGLFLQVVGTDSAVSLANSAGRPCAANAQMKYSKLGHAKYVTGRSLKYVIRVESVAAARATQVETT